MVTLDEQNQNEFLKDLLSPKKSPSFRSRYTDNYSTGKDKSSLEEAESFIDTGGFNIDVKKYHSLTILREYLYHCVIFTCIILAFIIPIFINTKEIIENINYFILIENYIYGRLISISASLLEFKCYISECKNTTSLNYTNLQSNDNIQEIIKGLENFKKLDNFYKNEFLLNACEAAIDPINEKERYELCLNDTIIISSNNTDNIIKVVGNLIDNLYKKDAMDKEVYENFKNETSKYSRQLLFNDTTFQQIEDIFNKYIFPVDYNFDVTSKDNLDEYLKHKKLLLLILVLSLGLLMIIYNITYLCIFVPKLVYLLNVSRCILRIIPTSVIMNSPELETWIENKY